jgi:ASC-1-like (ASCH) protein
MVKKEIFEWVRSGRKIVELRKGKAMSGDQAVFQCGRGNILRGNILKRHEDSLQAILQKIDFRKLRPTANSVEDVIDSIKKLYGTTDGTFTAYEFILS